MRFAFFSDRQLHLKLHDLLLSTALTLVAVVDQVCSETGDLLQRREKLVRQRYNTTYGANDVRFVVSCYYEDSATQMAPTQLHYTVAFV